MSPKFCSLAVAEIKDTRPMEELSNEFEPRLTILVSTRKKQDSDLLAEIKPVSIAGRISVSF